MSTFHITSLMHLYDAIKMENESAVPTSATEPGLIRFYNTTSGQSTTGTLFVSIQTGSSAYAWKPLIHTIAQGTGINVSNGGNGTVTISATGGGSGNIQYKRITIPKSSDSVTNEGICYAEVGTNTAYGFVYNAYKASNSEPVAVTVKANGNNSYVTIDFDGSANFTALNSAVIIDLLLATATPAAVTSTTAEPTPN